MAGAFIVFPLSMNNLSGSARSSFLAGSPSRDQCRASQKVTRNRPLGRAVLNPNKILHCSSLWRPVLAAGPLEEE